LFGGNAAVRVQPQHLAGKVVLILCECTILSLFLIGQALTQRGEFGIDDYAVMVQAFTRHVTHPVGATATGTSGGADH
jgi:hypothetical protein